MPTNSRIKILVDAHVFDDEFQGSRTFIREIYKELAKKKDLQLYLAAYDIDNLRKNFAGIDNIEYVPFNTRSGWKRLLSNIPSIIKSYGIEYAHFQYIVSPVKKCRYIVTVHDVIFQDFPEEFSWFYRWKKQLLYKRSAHKADILTTVSLFSKNSIEKFLDIKSGIHIVPNGISAAFFEPYDKDRAQEYVTSKYGIGKFVLYVSRIEQRKNHHLLLQAWLDLKLYQQGIHLVLLGHQSIRVPEFDQLMNSLSPEITQYIFSSSTVNDADLLEFYRAAQVFTYPSRAEGFGIPPLEAAALKIPVLCSNTSAMSDFTFFGENHVNPANRELFKERLRLLTEQPPRHEFLTKISETVRRKYDWEQSAETLYQAILADKNTKFVH